MPRSTGSLDAPLSLLIASVIVAIIKIPKKKTSSPNVKEKRKAGTRAGLTKAAIAAAAAKLIESVGANGFSAQALERDHLEDDAHRPLVHFWTGLRRHAERGQSQEQPLGEQGLQNGVRASACWATALKTARMPPSKWKWIVVGPTPSALASLRTSMSAV